jgi:hypothetical protein
MCNLIPNIEFRKEEEKWVFLAIKEKITRSIR